MTLDEVKSLVNLKYPPTLIVTNKLYVQHNSLDSKWYVFQISVVDPVAGPFDTELLAKDFISKDPRSYDDWIKAINRALVLINRLSGGKPGYGSSSRLGPNTLRAWSLYDVVDPSPSMSVEINNWSLDSINHDNTFIVQQFLVLVEAFINEIVADRLFLSDALEDLPFDLKMNEVYAETERKVSEVKTEFETNYLFPFI